MMDGQGGGGGALLVSFLVFCFWSLFVCFLVGIFCLRFSFFLLSDCVWIIILLLFFLVSFFIVRFCCCFLGGGCYFVFFFLGVFGLLFCLFFL